MGLHEVVSNEASENISTPKYTVRCDLYRCFR